jgi:hypothetical protein
MQPGTNRKQPRSCYTPDVDCNKKVPSVAQVVRAAASKVKIKNGIKAALAISESSNGEAPNVFMSHVAPVSWAATKTPETTLGNHSPAKAGFLSANQIEVFRFGSLATRNG